MSLFLIEPFEVGERVVNVVPLTFGRARINAGPSAMFYDDGW